MCKPLLTVILWRLETLTLIIIQYLPCCSSPSEKSEGKKTWGVAFFFAILKCGSKSLFNWFHGNSSLLLNSIYVILLMKLSQPNVHTYEVKSINHWFKGRSLSVIELRITCVLCGVIFQCLVNLYLLGCISFTEILAHRCFFSAPLVFKSALKNWQQMMTEI